MEAIARNRDLAIVRCAARFRPVRGVSLAVWLPRGSRPPRSISRGLVSSLPPSVTAPLGPPLHSRVERRPNTQFKNFSICEKLNDDTARYLQPGERVLDDSALTPGETVDFILEAGA